MASIAWTLWNYRLALIQALENAGYEVILLAADDAARLKLERHTRAKFIPLRQVNRSSFSPFQNFKLQLEIYRVFRRLKPDVALLFTIRPNILGNFAAAWLHIPVVSTVEGIGISGSKKGWLRTLMQTLYRLAFRSAQKVIFLNQDDLVEFEAKRMVQPDRALLVHGPGIDLQHFAPWPKTTSSPSKRIFLFVARLLAEKGIREFAAAARIMRLENRDAEFWVLGSTDTGNPTSIHSAELNKWIDEGIFQYRGFVDDVRPVVAEADVLVLPSYYREGVPRSVLEAMAMGKMIITTDNVGCRDTVEDGKNGYLVPPRDVPALVEAIQKTMALSATQIQQMGKYSRQKVEREFGDQLVLPQYLTLIQAAVS